MGRLSIIFHSFYFGSYRFLLVVIRFLFDICINISYWLVISSQHEIEVIALWIVGELWYDFHPFLCSKSPLKEKHTHRINPSSISSKKVKRHTRRRRRDRFNIPLDDVFQLF